MNRRLALASLVLTFSLTASANAGDLVRIVRYKLSAGDLPSGMTAVEDYRKATGIDAEYLDAVGWLARGAEMLRRDELAHQYVAELRRNITAETDETIVPLGAAIEVESKLIASHTGRGAAIDFLERELTRAKATPLRSRICKNINQLSLEGRPAPPIDIAEHVGATPESLEALRGKPVLLYFFAAGCGDCKAQSVSLNRIWQKYEPQGLKMIATTRMYGGAHDKVMTPAEERADLEKTWKELYPQLQNVPAVISTESMVRYGASATPTFVLVDRKGIVRLYTATRLSEEELSKRIEELLAETTT